MIEPLSDTIIYQVFVEYKIADYFADKSGMHYRTKCYVVIKDNIYQQLNGEVKEVKRITKELKGVLSEIQK